MKPQNHYSFSERKLGAKLGLFRSLASLLNDGIKDKEYEGLTKKAQIVFEAIERHF
jgi:hypothetical protein